tara:strand:+ start:318 stop:569 length:252 start_codon:yes stop_codon:yes gene_type:complete
MKKITWTKTALKQLRKIPANSRKSIVRKVGQYATAPESLANNVIRMQGFENVYRLRVGDWRVVIEEDGPIIAVLKVGPRGGVY